MKKKLLSIVLILALALSCFTAVVFATDGSEESAEVLGGKITYKGWYLSDKKSGEGMNTTVNTPFKGIDFAGKSSRTFKFAVYNESDAKITIGLGFGWAFSYATNVTRNSEVTNKDDDNYYNVVGREAAKQVSVGSKEYKIVSLTVPSGYYWVNNDKGTYANVVSNGSGESKVDGSGVAFRTNFEDSKNGTLYMMCIESEGVRQDEVKQINANLGVLKNSSEIKDWNEDIYTQSLKNYIILDDEKLGFYGLNYKINKGANFYKTLTPAVNVSTDGETKVESQLTVYNNSDEGVIVSVYPQYSWDNVNGDSLISQEIRVYIGSKEKHTFNVGAKFIDGKISTARGEKDATKGGSLFYRVDTYAQPDFSGSADDKAVENHDITVVNTGKTKFSGYEKSSSTQVFVEPKGYKEANLTDKPTMKMYNGDFEASIYKVEDGQDKYLFDKTRWASMKDATVDYEYRAEADSHGKWTLKLTAASKYSSILYNVAPAIAQCETSDGIFAGGGVGIYAIKFDAKADANAVGKYNLKLQGDGGGGNMIESDTPTCVTFTEEWETYTVYYNVTESALDKVFYNLHKNENADGHKLYLRLDGSPAGYALEDAQTKGGTYWLDNVTIEKVEFDAIPESSITVSDSLAFNVYAPTSVKKTDVTFNGEKTTLTPTDDNGKNKFTFSGITPEKMTDEITFVCYQEVTSDKFVTKEYKTSVKEYLETLLGDEKAGQLAIDTLNYGAMSQLFVNYKIDNLANKDLDKNSQKAYESLEKPESDYSQTGEGFAWASASLQLEDTVNIKFYIKESDYKEGMVVAVNETTLDDWKKSGDKMYVVYKGIKATELGETVTAKVLQGEEQVSKTLTYSVGTYVSRMWEKEDINLLKSLVKYGNSAKEYSAK